MEAAEFVRQTRPPDAVRCQISAFLLPGARLYVFAVIGHAGRRIRILGATAHPTASWVAQAARDFVMDLEDAGCRSRFMIRDRDGKYPALFDTVLEDAGIEAVLSGVRMSRMNALTRSWMPAQIDALTSLRIDASATRRALGLVVNHTDPLPQQPPVVLRGLHRPAAGLRG